jgi:hypothetical protein
MLCHSDQEWGVKLEAYVASEDLRKEVGALGRKYMDEHYSNERLLSAWDEVIAQLV